MLAVEEHDIRVGTARGCAKSPDDVVLAACDARDGGHGIKILC
jgi:hypothetical protein